MRHKSDDDQVRMFLIIQIGKRKTFSCYGKFFLIRGNVSLKRLQKLFIYRGIRPNF